MRPARRERDRSHCNILTRRADLASTARTEGHSDFECPMVNRNEEAIMGQIRDRMEGDLRLRNYRERTVREYLRCAGKFAEHFGRSPYRLGREEVREYLLGLKDAGLMPGTLKVDAPVRTPKRAKTVFRGVNWPA